MRKILAAAVALLPTLAWADAASYWAANTPTTFTTVIPGQAREVPTTMDGTATPITCSRNFYSNAATGNDSWSGTSAVFVSGTTGPWATIDNGTSKLNTLIAGDCLNVAAGTYTESPLFFQQGNADTATGYIWVKCSTWRQCFVVIPASPARSNVWNFANGRGYQIVDGFDVTSNNTNVNSVDGYPGINGVGVHYLQIINNVSHDNGGTGVGCTSACDHVLFSTNLVYNNAFRARQHDSGINILAPKPFDKANNWWHVLIRNNISYLNAEQEAGAHTDGNGIILDDLSNHYPAAALNGGQFPFWSLVENNLVVGNGGCGIVVFAGSRAIIRGNTGMNNGRDTTQLGNKGDFCNTGQNVWAWNIVIANAVSPAQAGLVALQDYGAAAGYGPGTWVNNFAFNGGVGVNTTNFPTGTLTSNNTVGTDPLLVDPTNANFSLQVNSTAQSYGYIPTGTRSFALPF